MSNSKISVLFSRPKEKLVDALSVLPSNRFVVQPFPTINIEAMEKTSEIDFALKKIDTFDIIVFTSHYAVLHTMQYLSYLGIRPDRLQKAAICTVGPMVSQQLGQYDLNTHMIPQTYTAKSLCDLFPWIPKHSKNVLFPKGDRAMGILEDNLKRKGYNVVSPIIYRTEFRKDLECDIESFCKTGPIDCLAFTSPSSVDSLASTLAKIKLNGFMNKTVIAAIGPTTQKACSDAGWPVTILPDKYTVQSMARSILRHYQKNPKIQPT